MMDDVEDALTLRRSATCLMLHAPCSMLRQRHTVKILGTESPPQCSIA